MNDSIKISPPKIKGKPILGHLTQIKKEGVDFYFNLFKKHGDIMEINIAHKRVYLAFHPEYNKEILIDKPDVFIKGAQYNPLRLVLGNGLLTSEGPEWQKQRKLLNPIFSKEGMDNFLDSITEITNSYIDKKIPTGDSIDWSSLMFSYTLEIAIASFFGKSFPSDRANVFTKNCFTVIRFVSRRMSSALSIPLFIPTKENLEFNKAIKVLKEIVSETYNQKIANKNISENSNSKDLIDLLILQNCTEVEVWDQIINFLIAGHETTAGTLSWLFHLLANNPEYQDVIRNEGLAINSTFSNSNQLSKFIQTNAIIDETMRLYPAGWVIARDIASDTTLGKYSLKQGSLIALSPLVTHRDPRFFKNPDSFIPERFIEGSEHFHLITKNSYLPFSLGRRNCIGARFAQLEMCIFAQLFFKKFKVSTQQKHIAMKGFVTLKTAELVVLNISKIDNV